MTIKKPNTVVNGDESSYDVLLKKIAELEKQLSIKEPKKKEVKEFSPSDYIKVMSLCNNQMNLSTRPRGQGKVFTFKKYGEIKRMLYSELQDIIANHQNFLEQGYFYILDKNIIELNGLDDLYTTILTKDQLDSVVMCSPDSPEMFAKATEKQKEMLVNMLIEKIRDNGTVDLNIISIISRISNVDILEKAKDAKADMELENE